MRKESLICSIVILSLISQGAELLKNPGFEGGQKLVPGLNKKYPEHWMGGWKDKRIPELITGDGAKQGKKYVRCENCSIHQNVGKIISGKNYCCWFWARGEGHLRVLFYLYGKKPNGKKGCLGSLGFSGKPFKVSPEWRLYKKTAVFKDGVDSIATAFVAKGKIEIDNVSFLMDEDVALPQRITALRKEWRTQLKRFAATFREDKGFRERFSPDIKKFDADIGAVADELAKKNDLPPEREYELKQKLERMRKQMRELIEKIKFEEVLR